MGRYAGHLRYGATVVAAILLFTAFVALFRRDLGDPLVAAATFAAVGAAVWVAGWLVERAAGRPSAPDDPA